MLQVLLSPLTHRCTFTLCLGMTQREGGAVSTSGREKGQDRAEQDVNCSVLAIFSLRMQQRACVKNNQQDRKNRARCESCCDRSNQKWGIKFLGPTLFVCTGTGTPFMRTVLKHLMKCRENPHGMVQEFCSNFSSLSIVPSTIPTWCPGGFEAPYLGIQCPSEGQGSLDTQCWESAWYGNHAEWKTRLRWHKRKRTPPPAIPGLFQLSSGEL